jgi:hypothetical protein
LSKSLASYYHLKSSTRSVFLLSHFWTDKRKIMKEGS